MCMPTNSPSQSGGSLTSAMTQVQVPQARADRLSVSSFASRGREFAFTIMLVACIAQKGSKDVESRLQVQTEASMAALPESHTCTLTTLLVLAAGSVAAASILRGGVQVDVEATWARAKKQLNSFFSSTRSAMSNVSSNSTITRIRSNLNASSKRLLTACAMGGDGSHDWSLAISAKDPFLSDHDTGVLTLAEMKDLFLYSAYLNGWNNGWNHHANAQHNYHHHPSLDKSRSRPSVKRATHAVDCVLILSRGSHAVMPRLGSVSGSSSSNSRSFADMDALAFIAACRIFAEWRSLRWTPAEGYPAFGISMSLARRDLLQNIAKMEKAVHSYMSHQQKPVAAARTTASTHSMSLSPLLSEHDDIRSPTLRQLIQFEIEQGLHRRRPCVADKSGANGLLWTVRQLRYVSNLLDNLTRIPLVFPNSKAAALAAYQTSFSSYHGFVTRHLFQASFDHVPEAHVALQQMIAPVAAQEEMLHEDSMTQPPSDSDDDDDEDVVNDAGEEEWVHLPLDACESFDTCNQEDDEEFKEMTRLAAFMITGQPQARRALVPKQRQPENPIERLGGHLTREWFKIHRFVAQCAGHEGPKHESRNIFHCPPSFSNTVLLDKSFGNGGAAELQVKSYNDLMVPLVDQLEALMNEMNLNDPSRV